MLVSSALVFTFCCSVFGSKEKHLLIDLWFNILKDKKNEKVNCFWNAPHFIDVFFFFVYIILMTRFINLSVAKRHKEDPWERFVFVFFYINRLTWFWKRKESVESTGFRAFYYDVFFFCWTACCILFALADKTCLIFFSK